MAAVGCFAELTVRPDPAREWNGQDARLRRIEDGCEARDGIHAEVRDGKRPVLKKLGIKFPGADLRDIGGVRLRERGNVHPPHVADDRHHQALL